MISADELAEALRRPDGCLRSGPCGILDLFEHRTCLVRVPDVDSMPSPRRALSQVERLDRGPNGPSRPPADSEDVGPWLSRGGCWKGRADHDTHEGGPGAAGDISAAAADVRKAVVAAAGHLGAASRRHWIVDRTGAANKIGKDRHDCQLASSAAWPL